MKIIIALLIFSAIIMFHEFGHFLFAKLSHIEVEEFSLGMGPRLISKKFGRTVYSLKLLPFGGSCAMKGEDLADVSPGSFAAAPVYKRIAVVAAGPVFNFILAFVLAIVIIAMSGSRIPVVNGVSESAAAREAGLQDGDVITNYMGYHVDIWQDFMLYWYLNPMDEDPVKITVDRDGEKKELLYTPPSSSTYLLGLYREAGSMTITELMKGLPLENAGLKAGDTLVAIDGFRFADDSEYDAYIKEHPLSDKPVTVTYLRDGLEYEAEITPAEYVSYSSSLPVEATDVSPSGLGLLKYSFLEVKSQIRSTYLGLGELFTGHLGLKDMSGPVGIVDVIGDTYEAAKEEGPVELTSNLLYIAVLLSANLGVMNLLPLPALDGGRLVFLLIEAIRRKPNNQEVEGMIHFAGMILLMGLMLVILFNDVMKLF